MTKPVAMIKPVGATRPVLTPEARALIRLAVKVFVRRGDRVGAARCRECLCAGNAEGLRLGKNSKMKGMSI